MIFYDTETCGLHGPIVLIQYAEDDGPVVLHCPWTCPIHETLTLIEWMMTQCVVGFNLVFDHFHLCQMYTTLQVLAGRVGFDAYPEDHINEYAKCEPLGRDGPCLKPASAFDLMLHARKGEYQSTMDRKDIRIKRVPTALAGPLAAELEKRIPLKDIYFARKKDKSAKRWSVDHIKQADGNINTDFRDIVLRFAPSSALKTLAVDALSVNEPLLFMDVEAHPKPMEVGWAPFALALSDASQQWYYESTKKSSKKKGFAWPGVIKNHISHWGYNDLAREYATKDVVYTRDLYYHFGRPAHGDTDSILACMCGAVRWRGYSIDVSAIQCLKAEAIRKSKAAPTAPKKVLLYVGEMLSAAEVALTATQTGQTIKESTKKVILEEISKWPDHPAAVRAKECLEARQAAKEVDTYDKLIQAGRFHVSLKVIGTKSSRMSGADGLNAQGIKHTKDVRRCFPLAFPGTRLVGGDFAGFEVAIADAVYNDPELRRQLCTCATCQYTCSLDEFQSDICPGCKGVDTRRKIHGLFGMELNPGSTYDDIASTKGSEDDWYDKGKRGVFSQLYGGNFRTLMTRIGIDEETAHKAEEGFANRFRGVKKAKKRIENMFSALRQPGGIGSNIEWHEPQEYIESLNGFRRYFTLENEIIRALYKLATKPPPAWKSIKVKVQRRDREQTVAGAAMSALYAAAFAIQSYNVRAAGNHVIQSTGALFTKELQKEIWELQPAGVSPWVVQPMNIHDEIMCPCCINNHPVTQRNVINDISDIVKNFVNKNRAIVPLLKIDWNDNMKSWAEK